MRNYILTIIVSVVASMMVTVILLSGFVQWRLSKRDDNFSDKVRNEIDARIMDVALLLEKQQAEQNMRRYPELMMRDRGLRAMDDIDAFFGFREPPICFPFPWCPPERRLHSFFGNMHRFPGMADSYRIFNRSWPESIDSSKNSYSVTWHNQDDGKTSMRYYHAAFEPPTTQKLQGINGDLVPQKTICVTKKNQNEHDVKYNLANMGKRSILWKEVDLGADKLLATSWLLDVYFNVVDFRVTDGMLYVKLADSDDILTISLDNGTIKDQGPDTKRIFASQPKQSCH